MRQGNSMKRRSFVAGSVVAALAYPSLAAAPASVRVALLGQSLIEHDLSPTLWPSRPQIAAHLSAFDVCFTNFETVILGPHAQPPTREALTLHTAKTEVFETLKALKINLLATSNNHAFDLGSGGIADTVAALRAAKLTFAGSGSNLKQAAAPGILKTAGGSVALVAFATGKVREGGAATNERPGVNELRRTAAGTPLEEDANRILQAIADARQLASIVIAYQHNHDWEPVEVQVPEWQRAFARRCVDAGAAVLSATVYRCCRALKPIRAHRCFSGSAILSSRQKSCPVLTNPSVGKVFSPTASLPTAAVCR